MKKMLFRILLATALFAVCILLFDILKLAILWLEFSLYLITLFIIGKDVYYKAIKNISRGKIFDENFLMAIATIGAFATLQFDEAIAVMLFYQIGEYFQRFAVDKSRNSIADLMNIRPDFAMLKDGDTLKKVDPESVQVGDLIVVSSGEKIPLDGKIVGGYAMLDTASLTGESLPLETHLESEVFAGYICLNGVLTIQVTKTFEHSTVSKILELVENSAAKKSKTEKFITRFARVYTPIVVLTALFLAVLPPIIFPAESFSTWIYRALTFLVISCPCALVVSIPMSFFGGIGGASRNGILIKGGNYFEILAKTDTVVFDKTGTLTYGIFAVQQVDAKGISQDKLLEYAAYAESFSNHPISLSLKNAYQKDIDKNKIEEFEELVGFGVKATYEGKQILVGNRKLMEKFNINYTVNENVGTIIYIAIDYKFAGTILIADKIKNGADYAIEQLSNVGIKNTVMLTGDVASVANSVANELGIKTVYSELLPHDKVEKLEDILNLAKGKVAFVGDGINDAPVLSRADIGIAMGGLGSDAAIEAADMVIMTDEISKIATAKKIAKKTIRIAKQNTFFALSIKFAVLVLSAFGLASMFLAVFADVGVAILAILNSLRTIVGKHK